MLQVQVSEPDLRQVEVVALVLHFPLADPVTQQCLTRLCQYTHSSLVEVCRQERETATHTSLLPSRPGRAHNPLDTLTIAR